MIHGVEIGDIGNDVLERVARKDLSALLKSLDDALFDVQWVELLLRLGQQAVRDELNWRQACARCGLDVADLATTSDVCVSSCETANIIAPLFVSAVGSDIEDPEEDLESGDGFLDRLSL
jgi:hypothetical protein